MSEGMRFWWGSSREDLLKTWGPEVDWRLGDKSTGSPRTFLVLLLKIPCPGEPSGPGEVGRPVSLSGDRNVSEKLECDVWSMEAAELIVLMGICHSWLFFDSLDTFSHQYNGAFLYSSTLGITTMLKMANTSNSGNTTVWLLRHLQVCKLSVLCSES